MSWTSKGKGKSGKGSWKGMDSAKAWKYGKVEDDIIINPLYMDDHVCFLFVSVSLNS
jgi:hypothetical protein